MKLVIINQLYSFQLGSKYCSPILFQDTVLLRSVHWKGKFSLCGSEKPMKCIKFGLNSLES